MRPRKDIARRADGTHRGLGTTDRRARPRQDSNLRTRLRRPALYPLSYEGVRTTLPVPRAGLRERTGAPVDAGDRRRRTAGTSIRTCGLQQAECDTERALIWDSARSMDVAAGRRRLTAGLEAGRCGSGSGMAAHRCGRSGRMKKSGPTDAVGGGRTPAWPPLSSVRKPPARRRPGRGPRGRELGAPAWQVGVLPLVGHASIQQHGPTCPARRARPRGRPSPPSRIAVPSGAAKVSPKS